MTPCSPVATYRLFSGTCDLHFLEQKDEYALPKRLLYFYETTRYHFQGKITVETMRN
jgi:hypothetical protein